MSPALNRNTALQHFKRSNAVMIHNRIMFNFYPGLPHLCYSQIEIKDLCGFGTRCGGYFDAHHAGKAHYIEAQPEN